MRTAGVDAHAERRPRRVRAVPSSARGAVAVKDPALPGWRTLRAARATCRSGGPFPPADTDLLTIPRGDLRALLELAAAVRRLETAPLTRGAYEKARIDVATAAYELRRVLPLPRAKARPDVARPRAVAVGRHVDAVRRSLEARGRLERGHPGRA